MSENIEIIKSNCPRDCYDGCGISIEKINGRISRVMGDEAHPVSRGRLCNKCAIAYNGVWQDANRAVVAPHETGRRQGGRVSLKRISWDEAVDYHHGAVKSRTLRRRGPQSIIHTHYSGTLSLTRAVFPDALFPEAGGLGSGRRTASAMRRATPRCRLLYGESQAGVLTLAPFRDSNCVLIWGANPSHSAPHTHKHWFAAGAGTTKIVVDPVAHENGTGSPIYHLQPRPGTDAALAFSLLHVMQREGLRDDDFVQPAHCGKR